MAYVIMVPGLAVRNYLRPSADCLRSHGHDVDLLPPIGWRSVGTDLTDYAQRIARHAVDHGPADLLIGLSIGTQAATLAAIATPAVRRLLLVSPTLDPARRSTAAALRAWAGGEDHRNSPRLSLQAHDWTNAGPGGIYQGLQSAIKVPLETELPRAAEGRPVTVVHADTDLLSPLPFAADIAQRAGARLLVIPDAPHSWPIGDDDRFVALVARLVSER
ncbi:alpha/beta fold hydrolase [Microlunatus sp. Gsoil 973]|jgi:pimeloyl-ACP methyl ester carboxylesterase|uniref:alpha/beta fold hydrolase n=1 Tax=Microlunatus sp. Gsoil 973 TaxID=2672569 RepID=UPI0012B46FE4|nr:alpha/beta fold hydrolase [Microlunatus sp. Gsoil 973]QGN33532.1 alpha/beta fold hydrolase [Microlunatus sp. Gsoil 973]